MEPKHTYYSITKITFPCAATLQEDFDRVGRWIRNVAIRLEMNVDLSLDVVRDRYWLQLGTCSFYM